MSLYSMWHIMLCDIHLLEQTNIKTFFNLTIHYLTNLSLSHPLSHPFKPWLALVLSTKYQNADNVMSGKN